MTPVKNWKPLLAVACSHGNLICPKAEAAVIKFASTLKPKTVIHLGDWCDTAALRGGAIGTPDEGEPCTPDIETGLDFLEKLGVTHCTMGNHDERPYRFLKHHNAVVREFAQDLVGGIEDRMRKLRINWVNTWSVFARLELYGVKWMHGYVYTENAARDHAEAHGRVVFGHCHTTMLQKARRDDNATGIAAGTLCRIRNMDYAKSRRKTLSWSGGFVWGYYHEKDCVLWLHENGQRQDWILPT